MRLKYSKARTSSWATPMPSAYMRPNFHCAIGWPPSAAYCSAVSEFELSGIAAGGTGFFSAAAVSGCAGTTGVVGSCLSRAPSNARAGVASIAAPNINAKMVRSDVRITLSLVRTPRMGHSPSHRWPNLLGILPQRTRRMLCLARRPFVFTSRQLGGAQFYVKSSTDGVDFDDIPIPEQPDRPADGGFRPDMADAEAAGGTGKPAIGDQRDLAAHALPGQGCRGRKHFPHAGTAPRSLVADDDDLTLAVGFLLDRLERILFAVEAAGWTGKSEVRHARDFHDGSLWREITLQANAPAGGGDRLVGRPHHILVRIPFHAFEVFGDRPARHGHAIPVKEAIIEQRLHQQRNAASFKHVFGDITAARLQIRDIGSLFEDFRYIKQVKLDAAFIGDRRQMQPGIGRAAGGGNHCSGVFQRLAGDDVARPDIGSDQVHHLLARGHAEGIADLVRRRRACR